LVVVLCCGLQAGAVSSVAVEVKLSQKKGGYTSSANGKKLSASGRLSSGKCDCDVKKGGQLTVKEDRVEGQVIWATYAQYAKDGGG
jgi:hypothetical protein